MKALRYSDPPRAFELSAHVIRESNKSGYEQCLPDAHHIRGSALVRMSKFEEATEAFEHAIAISRSLGSRVREGRATNGLGIVAKFQEDFHLAEKYFQSAIAIAEDAKDSLGKGYALHGLADIFDSWGLYEQATEYAQASYEALRGTPEEYLPLYELACLILRSGDDESALALYQRILDSPSAQDNKSFYAASCSQIGNIYFQNKDYVRAREYFQMQEQIARPMGSLVEVAYSLLSIGECDIKLGEFDAAEEKLHAAFRLNSEIGKAGHAGFALLSLATLEIARGNAHKALEYLSDCEARIRATGDREDDLDLQEGFSAAYELLGDWRKMAHHQKEWRRINEEMNSVRFKSKISAVQMLLGTEREREQTELQKLRAERFEVELANSTLHLLAQTELLSDLRADLLQIARKIPPTEPAARELQERVKNLPCQSIDWEKFDAQFAAAHPEFVKKLIERFPELTPMETRVCTLLRLNLKSHEIAKMFCLEERSIETHRFNIRKKLKLETKQSLSNFLNAL